MPVGDGKAETLDDGSDLLELPPIVTVLRARGRGEVTVRLEVHITELGALEIRCVDRASDETLEARVRHALGRRAHRSPKPQATRAAPEDRRGEGERRRRVHRPAPASPTLTRDLETLLEARRDEWSMQTTRALFDALAEVAAERKKTADHEQRWLNLAGFLLRPGTGAPLDAWRARVMWGVFNENLAFPKTRAEPARVVDRVAADRRRPREGPAGADLRSARAAAAAEHRSRRRSSPRPSRASRSSPRCGARSRASSACTIAHQDRSSATS